MGDPVLDLSKIACPNGCVSGKGSRRPLIGIRGRYGPNKEGILLYCRKCGKRFAAPRTKPFRRFRQPPDTLANILLRYGGLEGESIRQIAAELHLDKDTVNRALAEAEKHSMEELSKLMASLNVPEDQFDRFWRFIQKRRKVVASGSGKGRRRAR